MKCPQCKKGDLVMTKYRKPVIANSKDKGILKCKRCDHEEIFI